MKTIWYDKQGKPITTFKANELLGSKYKIVKQENVCFGLFWVSTVWLGLDHSFGGRKKLIFESMVFCRFPLPRLRYNYEIGWKEIKFAFNRHKPGRKKWYHFINLPYIKKRNLMLSNCDELDIARYTSLREALKGHKAMVKNWSNPKHLDGHLIKHLFSKR